MSHHGLRRLTVPVRLNRTDTRDHGDPQEAPTPLISASSSSSRTQVLSQQTPLLRRPGNAVFCGVLMLGLLTRVLAIAVFYDDCSTDPDGYLSMSRLVADGEGIVGPFTGQPTAFRPPLYPVLLGSLMWAGLTPVAALLSLNLICGVATVWLTWRLCHVFGLSGMWQITATTCVAVDPLLLRYTALPMTEVASACLLSLALVAWHSVFDHHHGVPENPKRRTRLILSGFVMGLLAMLRPIGFVVAVFLAAREVWRSPRQHLAQVCIIAAAAGVIVLPWIVRNYLHFDAIIPATTHGGYTLALGNNPSFYRDVIRTDAVAWSGAQLAEWQLGVQQSAAEANIDPSDEPAMDAFMYQHAQSAIHAAPATFARACLFRLQRFWSVRAVTTPASDADNADVDGRQEQPALRATMFQAAAVMTSVWYSLLWAGVALSLLHQVRSRGTAGLATLWLTVLSFLCIHTFYWTDARMRTPVMPLLCILAAAGWRSVLTRSAELTSAGPDEPQ